MKYTIVINQVGIVKAGFLGITDFSDWAIIAYIKDLFAHPKSVKLPFKDKLFVWINYKHIMEEMPMISISTKDPLTDRFKKLKKLSLIETVALKDNTIYIRLTEECMDIFSYKESILKEASITPPIGPNSDRVSAQTLTGGIGPNSDSTSSISFQADNQSSKVSCVSGNSPEIAQGVSNKKSALATSDTKQFIDYAFTTFNDKFGRKLNIVGSKDGSLVKRLCKTYTLTELKRYWDAYLDMDDEFFARVGYTIAVFSSSINKVGSWYDQREKSNRTAYSPSYYKEMT